ncbi:7850_t:CDS:2 [Paraglomus brasilianum]|uniref:7850_t:CDS:1 n=1 Tax=Paraglomus brasilianum TaxID=144538 RepID=A0A9N9CU74_9GLOM|nr:7850_t:CDS:2 [Paraglomus brasilianum]
MTHRYSLSISPKSSLATTISFPSLHTPSEEQYLSDELTQDNLEVDSPTLTDDSVSCQSLCYLQIVYHLRQKCTMPSLTASSPANHWYSPMDTLTSNTSTSQFSLSPTTVIDGSPSIMSNPANRWYNPMDTMTLMNPTSQFSPSTQSLFPYVIGPFPYYDYSMDAMESIGRRYNR